MKVINKKLVFSVALLMSGAAVYGVDYYNFLNQLMGNAPTQPAAVAPTAAADVAGAEAVNPAYTEIVNQIKSSVPKILNNAKILVPKLTGLAQQTQAGGVAGFIQGTVSLVGDSATRDAVIGLTNEIITTNQSTRKLSNADPSTKNTVKQLLSAIAKDPNVQQVISLADQVPIVGKQLHNKLQELINKVTTL